MGNYKYNYTPEILEELKKIYMSGQISISNKKGEESALRKFSKRIKIPYVSLCKKAINSGYALGKSYEIRATAWSKEEVKLIIKHRAYSAQTIRKRLLRHGYSRAASAITNKLLRLKRELDEEDEYYSSLKLSECFGVDVGTVINWIEKGFLKAKKANEEVKKSNHIIYDKDIYKFIKKYPAIFDIRKVDKFWFIDILTSKQRKGNKKGE